MLFSIQIPANSIGPERLLRHEDLHPNMVDNIFEPAHARTLVQMRIRRDSQILNVKYIAEFEFNGNRVSLLLTISLIFELMFNF